MQDLGVCPRPRPRHVSGGLEFRLLVDEMGMDPYVAAPGFRLGGG